MSFEVPFVRIVVLSFDGGQMTLDCIESLMKTLRQTVDMAVEAQVVEDATEALAKATEAFG